MRTSFSLAVCLPRRFAMHVCHANRAQQVSTTQAASASAPPRIVLTPTLPSRLPYGVA